MDDNARAALRDSAAKWLQAREAVRQSKAALKDLQSGLVARTQEIKKMMAAENLQCFTYGGKEYRVASNGNLCVDDAPEAL